MNDFTKGLVTGVLAGTGITFGILTILVELGIIAWT